MTDAYEAERFAVAVSVRESYKVGFGTTTQESERVLYYYAEKTPEAGILIQALNANSVPSGERSPVSEPEFFERYKPEPLIYYNQVKPRMEGMLAEIGKGEKHLEAGRTDKAEKAFQKALEFDAGNLRAIFGLGNTYLSAGKMEEAKEVFEKIMSIELAFGPENKFLFNEFGIRMRKCGLLDMAKAYYEKALAASEADENLHFNLGRIHYEMGRFAEAIAEADRCLAINPGFLIAGKLKKAAAKGLAAAPPADSA
ncbi:MAG: tetratricopeptide repeat protein [Solidesulfovibrio sp.]|uniref:tetratricopeptide repeat protein n=1 Tax=Solidesulfovibrio sp. TaxID=2910990 RepID=UPI0031594971